MRKQLVAQLFLLFAMISLLLTGCRDRSLDEPESASMTSSSQQERTEEPEVSEPEPADTPPLPPLVREDLESMLLGSSVITITPDGSETRTLFPGKGYTSGQLSADGRYLLCRKDSSGAGEAYWTGYVLTDLQSMEEWAFDGIQMGLQSHTLLPNGRIGFAHGSVVGGQEDTWQMFQLYDLNYQPVEMDWQFDFGQLLAGYEPRTENCPTGIGYSLAGGYYVVTYAQDLTHSEPEGAYPSHETFPNARSRLGVALLDDAGAVIK